MIKIKKVVRCSEVFMGDGPPKIYGLAYCDYCRALLVFYPFPLNHLVKFLRNLWFCIRDVSIKDEELKVLENLSQKRKEFEKNKDDLIKHAYNVGYSSRPHPRLSSLYGRNYFVKKTVAEVLCSVLREGDKVLK